MQGGLSRINCDKTTKKSKKVCDIASIAGKGSDFIYAEFPDCGADL